VNHWVNKDTEIYCSFAENAGNTGCQMMNTAFYYYGLNKIYKSFSVKSIEDAVNSVKTLDIKGFAITMPYKIDVLNYVDDMSDDVKEIGAANTVLNFNDGFLHAYNTDAYAARTFLEDYDNQKKLYILGDGGYSKAVRWGALQNGFDVQTITRSEWDDIYNITGSVVYNCTPVDVESMVNSSNDFINCLVHTKTGRELARLQASKQYELYTGMDFPL
jgi:shikimate dehydrogenase